MPSPVASRPIAIPIDSTDNATILKLKAVLASAFRHNPVTIALICNVDEIQPSSLPITVDGARISKHFDLMFEKFLATGAIFLQAGDWSTVSIWEVPGIDEPAPINASGADKPLKREWNEQVRIVRSRHLAPPSRADTSDTETRPPRATDQGDISSTSAAVSRLRPYYHLALVGRDPNITAVPGATSAVIVPILQRAKQEGVPAWLEATAPAAVSVYEHFGFRVAEKGIIGKGTYDANGWPRDGGEGVGFWAMIFDGHLEGS